ncbi:MAG TPA: hypothetical protein VKZ77_14395 [Bacillaceae bacterium]|nr:hypothetical protein [Paenibacillus bovis]HLU23649.1 hypothetical protein [Bacillaceae bacterium]
MNEVIEGKLKLDHAVSLAPLLEKEHVKKLINEIGIENFNSDSLSRLAPFIDQETLKNLVTTYMRTGK